MQVITIGKRLVPADQIAFVEAFDPARNPEFKTDKDFKGRVVLLNRDTVLTEMTPQDFAATHGLYLLAEDNVAISKTLAFRVEIFARAIPMATSRASCWSPSRKQSLANFRFARRNRRRLPKGHRGGRRDRAGNTD